MRFAGKEVLKGLSLRIPRGQIVGLLGPNGAGKTTLLRILSGLLKGWHGPAVVAGQEIGQASKAKVSYLPDKPSLANWMRVQDAVHFYAEFFADFDQAKAQTLLTRLHLDAQSKIGGLSKGTVEKVQVVLTMSRKAELYLLDEPISGVDPAAREVIMDTILSQYEEDSTIILSTHMVQEVERIFDSVVFLKEGQVVLQDAVETLREEHQESIDDLFKEVFRC